MAKVLQRSSCVDMAGIFCPGLRLLPRVKRYFGLTGPVLRSLASILQSDATFAEQVLPVLVQSVLKMTCLANPQMTQDSYSQSALKILHDHS